MAKKEDVVKLAEKIMDNLDTVRNIGIVAHIDHGKTTLTDNLIAANGLIAESLAGKQRVMDSYVLEQERGITINASNVSLIHKAGGKDYLINLIDTP
ncbi:MAG: elongation factor EF-2, partial [Candidatus Dadabacteria bacterium]